MSRYELARPIPRRPRRSVPIGELDANEPFVFLDVRSDGARLCRRAVAVACCAMSAPVRTRPPLSLPQVYERHADTLYVNRAPGGIGSKRMQE